MHFGQILRLFRQLSASLLRVWHLWEHQSDGTCTDEMYCDVSCIFCCCRKYDQALEYHRQALVLIPQHASTYSAIGYVHSLMGDFESAIDYFHTVSALLVGSHVYFYYIQNEVTERHRFDLIDSNWFDVFPLRHSGWRGTTLSLLQCLAIVSKCTSVTRTLT